MHVCRNDSNSSTVKIVRKPCNSSSDNASARIFLIGTLSASCQQRAPFQVPRIDRSSNRRTPRRLLQ
ncbi:hypothetical protein PsYK624_004090 [Phanerochaete sordida]|uniref:Uncharacterized protein n=1 Tax=Phanerochaete sordida TaxID=48140 RepID=A0A9P3FWF1_9APHY|nr:hypothetical protein PsYK624_004090 [Phanerochaete sordida]